MKIIVPDAEIWYQKNTINGALEHIVKCAKVCYRSNKETDNEKFIAARLKAGHISILRHATSYYKVSLEEDRAIHKIIDNYENYPGFYSCMNTIYRFIAANHQFLLENPSFEELLQRYRIDIIEATNTIEIFENILRYTFYVTTQISTSRELNRVSPNNILEESTRYVEQSVICRPWWFRDIIIEDEDLPKYTKQVYNIYKQSVKNSFNEYSRLIDLGLPKEDARGVLPLDTATHCVYTYTISEWRDIIDKRYFGITGKPHPNAREVVEIIKNLLEEEGHEF